MRHDGTLSERPVNNEHASIDCTEEAQAFSDGAIAVGRIEPGRRIGSVRLDPHYLDTDDDRLVQVLDRLHEQYPDVLWYVFDSEPSVKLAA